jgi:hypothetical protein
VAFGWTCGKCGRIFEYDTKQKLAVSKYKHENRAGGCGPPSRLADGSPNPEYFKDWYNRKGDYWRAHVRRTYRKNPEPKKKASHRYYEENTESILAKLRRSYAENPQPFLDKVKRYLDTPKGRDAWRKSMVKVQARRRGLPILFILNERFRGADLHHAEENIGAFLPPEVHKLKRHNLRTGKNMIAINEILAEWLAEQSGTIEEAPNLLQRLEELKRLSE